jgi:phenylalanyl-tRNA synthetase beta chain
MKVPLSWLAEYVELVENNPKSVMEQLVRVGIEEESAIGGDISGPVVVGKVLEFVEEPQSNGKTIRWCQVQVAPDDQSAVDGGEGIRGIVCGARNFEVGDKVVVSLPGSVLPGGFSISARKTYGHVSDGMIASSKELGLGDDHAGILRLGEIGLDPELGVDAIELLGLGESAAEVNVTPDRGYCLSIRGIAREYSHATGKKYKDPASLLKPLSGQGFPLRVEDSSPIHDQPGCSSFVLLAVEGIDAKAPTPAWMANRLKLSGMRSISIAVDITNYVMLELGQPLHAYDLEKLTGGITVRRAKQSELITTLDGKQRKLDSEDLLICDESGPIGIAGVMGGASTEVSETTTKVLLEAAIFDPISIARSARRHKLPSEASKRFERGVDPEVSAVAAHRAAKLLEELAGGKISKLGSNYSSAVEKITISLPSDFPSKLVGFEFSDKQVVSALEMIGCEVKSKSNNYLVTPPTWRPDLRHKTDLVEEVARLIGYHEIPSTLPVAPPGRGLTRNQHLRRNILSSLVGAGMVEVLNYPFLSPEQNKFFSKDFGVELENPLQAEYGELRKELLPGLLMAAARNISRGITDVAIVEEGSVFHATSAAPVLNLPVGNQRPSQETLQMLNDSIPSQPRHLAGVFTGDWVGASPTNAAIEAGYPQAISALQVALKAAGVGYKLDQIELDGLHPGRSARVLIGDNEVGFVGELHPDLAQELHLPRRVGVFELDLDRVYSLAPQVLSAREVIAMPALTQDLSLVVPVSVAAQDLSKAITEAAGELLESLQLVDQYQGEGIAPDKKSLTFSLVFRAKDKTLTQTEANEVKLAAVAACESAFGAEIRS